MTLQKSWSSISDNAATSYLSYYPTYNKHQFTKFIKPKFRKARILELGCGNLNTYKLLTQSLNFEYTGVDFSLPLINAAKKVGGKGISLIHKDIYEYLESYDGPRFDIILMSHLIELVESQDLLLHYCAKHAPLIAIFWFDPPAHRFHRTEFKVSAHPSETKYAPYLRIKTSTDFYKHLLEKHNLKIIYKSRNPETPQDVLHILESQ